MEEPEFPAAVPDDPEAVEAQTVEPDATATEGPTPGPGPEPTDFDILQAKLDAIEAERGLWRQRHDKQAGRAGYYLDKARQAGIELPDPADDPVDEEDILDQIDADLDAEPVADPVDDTTDEAADHEPEPSPEEQRLNLETWVLDRAIRQTVSEFTARHNDAFTDPELREEIADYLRTDGVVTRVLDTDDPTRAQLELSDALERGYKQAMVSRLEAKRDVQRAQMYAKKLRASISGGGSTPPAPPPRVATADLSVEQLESRMRQLRRR